MTWEQSQRIKRAEEKKASPELFCGRKSCLLSHPCSRHCALCNHKATLVYMAGMGGICQDRAKCNARMKQLPDICSLEGK